MFPITIGMLGGCNKQEDNRTPEQVQADSVAQLSDTISVHCTSFNDFKGTEILYHDGFVEVVKGNGSRHIFMQGSSCRIDIGGDP